VVIKQRIDFLTPKQHAIRIPFEHVVANISEYQPHAIADVNSSRQEWVVRHFQTNQKFVQVDELLLLIIL
jgi:hypothetical protein